MSDERYREIIRVRDEVFVPTISILLGVILYFSRTYLPTYDGDYEYLGVVWFFVVILFYIFGELITPIIYGSEFVEIAERIARSKELERNREAEKKARRSTKKVFFGLWERELTTREMLNEWIYKPSLEEIRTAREEGDHERVSEVLQRLGIEDSDSSDDSSERRKAGVVDYLDAATMVRCTHCDGPTEGGPRRGTYLCAPCGFLFDSHGNAI
jgi:hypothetical protein